MGKPAAAQPSRPAPGPSPFGRAGFFVGALITHCTVSWRCSPVDNPLPLEFRPLKVNEQRQSKTGSLEVIDALSNVLVCKTVNAFQFDQDLARHQQVSNVVADA